MAAAHRTSRSDQLETHAARLAVGASHGSGPAKKRGPKQKTDISYMAMCALLLVRSHGAQRKPAVRAAILAYFTWGEDQDPGRRVEIFMTRVSKALQRLESGKTSVHPRILDAVGWCDRSTKTPVFGTPQELAQAVAEFLPQPK